MLASVMIRIPFCTFPLAPPSNHSINSLATSPPPILYDINRLFKLHLSTHSLTARLYLRSRMQDAPAILVGHLPCRSCCSHTRGSRGSVLFSVQTSPVLPFQRHLCPRPNVTWCPRSNTCGSTHVDLVPPTRGHPVTG